MRRGSFKQVCLAETSHKSLNDLSDDVLARIFGFVVGPMKRQEHYINNGILVRHEHMEPTMVSNFDDLIVLNLVCKRWHKLVQNSVNLWKNVHISSLLLGIPRRPSAWLKMFFWISRHAEKIECLHLADESAFRDQSLDLIKMGALSTLAINLRVLHLDNCFHRGANADFLSIFSLMKKLEQLQISSVNHDFVANIGSLAKLPNLKRLQLQGNGDYWDGNCPVLALTSSHLPSQIEVISLQNIRVRGFCEEADEEGKPLRSLKVLELVYVEWVGLFVSTVSLHVSLEKLYIIDCDKIVIETPAVQRQDSNWGSLASCTKLTTFILRNNRYGDFCIHMSRDFTGLSALSNLTELELSPDVALVADPAYYFDEHFSGLKKLTKLNFTNIGLTSLPTAIRGPVLFWGYSQGACLGLPNLKVLNLTSNKLSTLPLEEVNFADCLELLILDSNCFTEIPDLSKYRSLTGLHISNNPLKFCTDCDYLAALPSLKILRLGNRRLLDVFPISSSSQVDEICKDLNLCPIGGFRLGSLCSSLRHKNPKCRLLM